MTQAGDRDDRVSAARNQRRRFGPRRAFRAATAFRPRTAFRVRTALGGRTTKSFEVETPFEGCQLPLPEISDCLDFKVLEFFFRDFSDSRQSSNRQRSQERIDLFGLDDE